MITPKPSSHNCIQSIYPCHALNMPHLDMKLGCTPCPKWAQLPATASPAAVWSVPPLQQPVCPVLLGPLPASWSVAHAPCALCPSPSWPLPWPVTAAVMKTSSRMTWTRICYNSQPSTHYRRPCTLCHNASCNYAAGINAPV